jgi:TP901 family phage tail tape measure protein
MVGRDPSSGRYVATATVQIIVPMSKLAKAFAAARAMAVSAFTSMGRAIVATMARTWSIVAAGVRRVGSVIRGTMSRMFGVIRRFLPMGGLLGGLGGGFALIKTMTTFADFEQAMARVQAVTGATTGDFARLSGEARRLGQTTIFSASQAAEAMGNFAVAGFSVDEIMGAMEPTLNLAAAGQLDMATASDITAKLMRGMGLDASDMTRAVDVMANAFTTSNTDLVQLGAAFNYVGPVGLAAGKSMEELTAAIQIMSDSGIQGEQAGAALRNILLRMQTGTREVKKAFETLGITISDKAGNMKHMSVIIDELRAKTKGMTSVQRNAILSQIAGIRAASALNTLIAAGGDVYREREKALGKSGTADKIAAIQMNTLQSTFSNLMSAVEEAAISFGQAMAPAIRSVMTALQPFVVVLGKVLESVKPVVNWIAGNLVDGIKAATTWLKANTATFNLWGEQIKQIMSNVAGAYQNAFLWLSKLLGIDASGMLSGMGAYIEAMAAITTSPGLAFGAVISLLKAGFFYGAEIFVKALRTWTAAWLATLTTTFMFLAKHWADIFRIAWKSLVGIFSWLLEALTSWGSWLVLLLVEKIKGAFKMVATADILARMAARKTLRKTQARPETWTDLGSQFGDAWMASFTKINEVLKQGLTGGVESSLRKEGDYQMWKSGVQWWQAKSAAAAGRPEVRTPWMDMWRGIGEKIPGIAAAAMNKGTYQNLWDKFIAGPAGPAGKKPGDDLKKAVKATGGGQMSDLVGYLTSLQSSIGKQDKQDDIATATEDTAENTGEDGPIVRVLKKIDGKKNSAVFAGP